MSDLQDLHRQASRALISFAPSILDKPASSECPERMGWHISASTKAAPRLQAEHYRTQSLGKSAVRRSKRLNRRNSESQFERPVTRTIETICPFGGRIGDLTRARQSAGSPRADACLAPAFAVKVEASVQTVGDQDMTDGDKIAAAVMAAGLCSKVNASPDEYVQNYFDILQKMSQQEGAAQQRRWNAPKG
jgi:hypothetical protein